MNQQSTLEKIKELRLHGMYKAFSTALQTSPAEQFTADELLGFLVDAEYNFRNTLRIKSLMRNARFRYQASIEEVSFAAGRNLSKNNFMRLADCSFVGNKENLIVTGPTGVGKSYLVSALGQQACIMGYKVRYYNMSKLFTSLKMSKADNSYLKEISKIEKQHLLILDDFGLHPIDAATRIVLLEIIEDRHGKASTIIASQVPVVNWYELLGEQTIADTILDRIVHTAHRIELQGESLRKKAAKQA